ncbi:MAG TPA: hypothetical protein VIT23_02160, partial [Terrimicrobiaceae bacterium]
MKQSVKHHLALLYGKAATTELEESFDTLVSQSQQSIPKTFSGKSELTEADCMLITYGDQVRAAGKSPLQALANFLASRAKDILSAVHILPFYPSSSDDGFSVMDYYAVDPELGGWNDVESLRERFDLMFD